MTAAKDDWRPTVLDAYIIEQIRKRDEERRRILERPAIEIPLEPAPMPVEDEEIEEPPSRVVVIDI